MTNPLSSQGKERSYENILLLDISLQSAYVDR